MVRKVLWVSAAGWLAFLAACSSSEKSTKTGDLGRGSFRYSCASSDDTLCGGAKPSSSSVDRNFDFPNAIASGGRFKMTFQAKDTSAIGNGVLKPASTEFVNDEGVDQFLAKRPGRVAIVARSTATGKVADLTYVTIAAVASLVVKDGSTAVTKVTLVRSGIVASGDAGAADAATTPSPSVESEGKTIRVEPIDSTGLALAGALTGVTWTSSAADVVTVTATASGASATLKAVRTGLAKIEARTGDTTTSIDVEVR